MSNPPNRNLIQRTIVKSAKRVIVASGLNQSTRSGSKALEYLAKQLSEQCSMAAATPLGEALGEQVVALSQQMGRQNLDQGVIRQLVLNKQVPIPTESQLAPVAASPKPVPPKAEPPKPPVEVAAPVVSQPLADVDVQPEVEVEDIESEQLLESEVTGTESELDMSEPEPVVAEEAEADLAEPDFVVEAVDLDEGEDDESEDELVEQPEAVEAEVEVKEPEAEPEVEDEVEDEETEETEKPTAVE